MNVECRPVDIQVEGTPAKVALESAFAFQDPVNLKWWNEGDEPGFDVCIDYWSQPERDWKVLLDRLVGGDGPRRHSVCVIGPGPRSRRDARAEAAKMDVMRAGAAWFDSTFENREAKRAEVEEFLRKMRDNMVLGFSLA